MQLICDIDYLDKIRTFVAQSWTRSMDHEPHRSCWAAWQDTQHQDAHFSMWRSTNYRIMWCKYFIIFYLMKKKEFCSLKKEKRNMAALMLYAYALFLFFYMPILLFLLLLPSIVLPTIIFLYFFVVLQFVIFFSLSFTSSICYFVVIHQIICSVMMFNFTFCSSFSLLCCWPDLWLILFSLLLLLRPCWFYIVFILFFVILFNILFLISFLMIMFSERWCHCSILDVLWDPASKPRRIMF